MQMQRYCYFSNHFISCILGGVSEKLAPSFPQGYSDGGQLLFNSKHFSEEYQSAGTKLPCTRLHYVGICLSQGKLKGIFNAGLMP